MSRVRVDVQTAKLEIGARSYPVVNGYAEVDRQTDVDLCRISNVGVARRHALGGGAAGKVCGGCGFRAWWWTHHCPRCGGASWDDER